MKNSQTFRDFELKKAWLIVTVSNTCKDMLSTGWSRHIRFDEKQIQQSAVPFQIDETLKCVMALPEKYKTAINMFYYEGYSAKETASYLGKTESSVWGYLHKGRSLLKLVLREAH
ncbi:MAG: sigma factor-like helix-turn-helix DNA-binding protein [Clostridia bacterium]